MKLKVVMKSTLSIFFLSIFLMFSGLLYAQEKWNLNFRPAVNFATQDVGDAEIKTGFGFEFTVGYKIVRPLTAYVGWGWNQFTAEESFAGINADIEETGYVFGLQFNLPVKSSKMHYWVSGGGIYNHIETENSSGDLKFNTDHKIGFQIAAGLKFVIAETWRLSPDVRYRSLSTTIKSENIDLELSYLSFGIGLSKAF
ncbi:porin family protein [Gillisia sp. M10.2A]|uniref:Porin family protein n=1 Tax=Gillisia lutea TaxID=2909668 RepID=A0ABS9EEA8_9FLAO|nr:outer membrane beta-barrel protein [Gillisia lutea]MCF4100229.1 porin family protein [Gillisia lutea]